MPILRFLLAWLILDILAVDASPAMAGELSPSQVTALRAIAVSRPYAATLLLYTLSKPAGELQGDLYLQRLLSGQDVDEQLKVKDAAALAALQWNPYASATFVLRGHWLRVPLGHDAFILITSAELVDARGASLQPSHTIEPVTTALVSGDEIRLLDASAPM